MIRATSIAVAVAVAVTAAGPIGAFARPQAHPDLTGTWMAPMAVHEAGFPEQGGVTPWAPVSGGDPRKQLVPTLADAMKRGDRNAAALAKSGGDPKVLGFGGPPPAPPAFMTPAGGQAMRRFDRKLYEEHDLACYPFNLFSRLEGGLGPVLIVQNPKAIMMATSVNGDNYPRVVYLGGETAANALPSFEGFSVGRWVGSTLHVETTKIKGDYFNMTWPLSENARLVEDFRVVGAGKTRKLEVVQTVIDPQNYKEPVARVSYLDWRPDVLVQDFPCEEGKVDQVEVAPDHK
jgi:hypothetical protein